MKMSRRIENLPPYLFVEISNKIAEKKARGEDIVSFAIGDPDIPTPSHIIARLCQAAGKTDGSEGGNRLHYQ
jgi:LL-diaminopimelate aminotransferase